MVACGVTAIAGVLCVDRIGPAHIVMCSMPVAARILRVLELHAPAVPAVRSLPFVKAPPSLRFPLAVPSGTTVETALLLAWRRFEHSIVVRAGWHRIRAGLVQVH